MVWRVISVILVFFILMFGFVAVLNNLEIEPVELTTNYLEPESIEIVDYGAVPVFAENLRFNHNLISYHIDEACSRERRSDMVAAFNIFSEQVEVISFYEYDEDSDIKVLCSDDSIDLGEDLFAAGEGGPSRIINTSGFKMIEEGKIILYSGVDCKYPIVELHELGHVFGFDHSLDPDNIMFNVSGCDQRMSQDMRDVMKELYSIEPLGDARIESVDAFIEGRYLNFNISILNEGLIGIDAIDLTILADGEVVDVVDMGSIEVGYGRTLRIENMKVGGQVEKIEFVLDADNVVREFNEENNVVEMTSLAQ